MKIDPALQVHINAMFAPLNNEAAVNAFPPPASLREALHIFVPLGSKIILPRNTSQNVAKMFTTAAVNIWLRGVHSFLISASLTDVSPVWASVAGYYSSHYAIRAFAHLLGYFQLFARKQIVRLELRGGRYVCTFDRKAAGDREHRIYWKIVKRDQHFAADPFFTENYPLPESPESCDVTHRDWANYIDHLPQFPLFHPLQATALRNRIDRISEIEIKSPPIPRSSQYPDLDNVQIVAYHRFVRFRELLDTVLGHANRFWNVHRDPAWAREFLDFQLTEEPTLRSQFTL